MQSDELHLYAATYTRSPKALRITKATMQVEARLRLDIGRHGSPVGSYGNGIAAITHSGDRLYIGADSTPARFQELSPGSYYVPRDCKLSSWGPWSVCDTKWRKCGGGRHT